MATRWAPDDAVGLVDEAGELALSATGAGQTVALVFDLPA